LAPARWAWSLFFLLAWLWLPGFLVSAAAVEMSGPSGPSRRDPRNERPAQRSVLRRKSALDHLKVRREPKPSSIRGVRPADRGLVGMRRVVRRSAVLAARAVTDPFGCFGLV
jgi:hypothetical protein